jgi:hypothetical protein
MALFRVVPPLGAKLGGDSNSHCASGYIGAFIVDNADGILPFYRLYSSAPLTTFPRAFVARGKT